MEIYIEYALAENFLLDAMLLWLAMKAAKQEISLWRIVLAAAIGAAFAVAFPLLKTGKTIAYILKFSVGALLCLVAVKGKGIGRYALTALLFFGFSFALGGALLAVYSAFSIDYGVTENGYLTESAPVGLVLSGSAVFAIVAVTLTKRLYRRRAMRRFVYPCKIELDGRTVKAEGFFDSGNRAQAGGIPVCFLSPDLAFDLLGDKVMTEEMTIMTMGGESRIKIFLADSLEIYCGDKPNIIKKVYFAPSGNIRAREYKIILNAAVLAE
ncbi:MAG: sigma-E processing peptidase SpoIIGA [Coriobacteriales bacterium]